jgi:hypothetical protein
MQEDGVSMAAAVALDAGRRDVDGVGVARRRRSIKPIRRRRSPSTHRGLDVAAAVALDESMCLRAALIPLLGRAEYS